SCRQRKHTPSGHFFVDSPSEQASAPAACGKGPLRGCPDAAVSLPHGPRSPRSTLPGTPGTVHRSCPPWSLRFIADNEACPSLSAIMLSPFSLLCWYTTSVLAQPRTGKVA